MYTNAFRNLCGNCVIWAFHVTFLSIIMPKNLAQNLSFTYMQGTIPWHMHETIIRMYNMSLLWFHGKKFK